MWNSNHESVDLLFWSWDSQICRTAFGYTRFIRWTFHEKSDKFKFHRLILESKSTRGLSKDGTCLSDVICISFDSLLTDILISSDIRQRWISGTVMAICRWMISCSPLPAHICLSTIWFLWGIQIFKLCQTVSSHWERGRRAESPSWRQRSERLVLKDDYKLYDEVPFVAQQSTRSLWQNDSRIRSPPYKEVAPGRCRQRLKNMKIMPARTNLPHEANPGKEKLQGL